MHFGNNFNNLDKIYEVMNFIYPLPQKSGNSPGLLIVVGNLFANGEILELSMPRRIWVRPGRRNLSWENLMNLEFDEWRMKNGKEVFDQSCPLRVSQKCSIVNSFKPTDGCFLTSFWVM